MRFKLIHLIIISCFTASLYSQITYNANTKAGKYNGDFLYGCNMGSKTHWTDSEYADMLTGNSDIGWVGIGVKSLRPALYHSFLETYDYTIRLKDFQHYKEKGVKTNTIFIGDRPSAEYQEDAYYCKDKDGNTIMNKRSQSYKNLYEPIWIEKNGKKEINPENYYAHYVYKLVQVYGEYVNFYEIKNEPDFTHSGGGDKSSGVSGNWWDNDPDPLALDNFYAPVQSYIRMLRVSYEVIKHLNPDALICLGGIGYRSFLDAILRNTDNPDNGKVTEEYPFYGGAWFDCLSYHCYPMYYLKKWVGVSEKCPDGFQYNRHSDVAVKTVFDRQKQFEKVLNNYGYDGRKYPKKEIILTETNVSSQVVENYIGGEEVQRNFLMKSAIVAQKNNVSAIYPYGPADNREPDEEGGAFHYQGFYYPIPAYPAADKLREHESGTGWRALSYLLDGKKYNEQQTQSLNLSDDIDGAVFGDENEWVYTLWAKTTKDMDETASAIFNLPESGTRIKRIVKWDKKSKDYLSENISSKTVELTGDVLFIVYGNNELEPQTILVSDTLVVLENTGETYQLSTKVYPAHAANNTVTWESSNSNIATINNNGLITAKSKGNTTVKVAASNGISDICKIVVGEKPVIPAISVELDKPYNNKMLVGETLQVNATLIPQNATDKTVLWWSSNNSVAKIDKNGLITAQAPGKAYINGAAQGGPNGQRTIPTVIELTVNENPDVKPTGVSIDKKELILRTDEEFELTATVEPAYATDKSLLWSSNNPNVATVNKGLVLAANQGTAEITVSTSNGKTDMCIVTVDNDIYIPVEKVLFLHSYKLKMMAGDDLMLEVDVVPFNASDKSLILWSTNTKIAKIDATGLLTALSPGTSYLNVKARYGPDGQETKPSTLYLTVEGIALEQIDLDILQKKIKPGETFKLEPLFSPNDATNKKVVWQSKNSDIADVDENGIVTAVSNGETNITVKSLDGAYTQNCKVIVDDITGIEDNLYNIDIVTGENQIRIKSEEIIKVISVFDMEGKLLKKKFPDNTEVYISDLPKGLLIFHIGFEKGEIQKKVLFK